MTYEEALAAITRFCGQRPAFWDEQPLRGTPVLYLAFEDPSDPPDDRQSSGLFIVVDVDGRLVTVHVGLDTATLSVHAVDRQMLITLVEEMGQAGPAEEAAHPSLF
jgi:hypothetical protein